jgi:hypothetical protein
MHSPDDSVGRALSRRQWFQLAGLHALAVCLPGRAGAAEAAPAPALPPLNRFPRMVQEYFVGRVRAAERACLQAR